VWHKNVLQCASACRRSSRCTKRRSRCYSKYVDTCQHDAIAFSPVTRAQESNDDVVELASLRYSACIIAGHLANAHDHVRAMS
jgi:hypothetical protein